MKWVSFLLVVVLCVVAVAVVSCTKPADEDAGPVVAPPRPTPPPPVEEPAEESEEATTEAADPMAVAEAMGVELPEGATPKGCEPTEDGVQAAFEVDMPYEEVKAFYLEKCADWENNGFEGGAMTGNDWEFTGPDGKMAVQVTSESMDPPTTIELSMKCEPGEIEGLMGGAAADDAAESAVDDAAAEPADDATAEPAPGEPAPAEEETTE